MITQAHHGHDEDGRKREKLRLTREEEQCVREEIEAEREKG